MEHAGNSYDPLTEYERSMSRAKFAGDPSRWIGNWMLGRMVYVLYKAIHFALFIGYYGFPRGNYHGPLTEYERSMSRARFSGGPWRWIGNWILGGMVYVLYKAIDFTLFIGYYGVFRPWRKLAP